MNINIFLDQVQQLKELDIIEKNKSKLLKNYNINLISLKYKNIEKKANLEIIIY